MAEFRVAQMFSEGAGDALLVAERDPVTEGGGLGASVLGGVGLAGELESRFECTTLKAVESFRVVVDEIL